jgi:uncharacterized protein
MSDELQRHHRQDLARKRRLRRFLKLLPRRANVSRYPVVKWFAKAAKARPFLWSFKRGNVVPALYAGSVIALTPLYGLHFVLAFVAALLLRANLTVIAALQLSVNPFTLGPIYYVTYKTGMWFIEHTGLGAGVGNWGTRVNALFIGGAVVGVLTAFAVDIAWRVAAWESARFRARLHALRSAAKKPDLKPTP